MKKCDKKSGRLYVRPMSLLIIISASIFASAAFVDLLLSVFPPLLLNKFAFLHAGLLVVMLFPITYYLVFDPLTAHIKELERSEEALQMSEAKYRSLVESTDDSIYLVNRSCEYMFMNARHRSRVGFFFSNDYARRPYSDFHSPEETRLFGERVAKVFETGGSVQDEHISQRDGRHFLRTLSPIRGANTEIVAVSVISKSITSLTKGRDEELRNRTAPRGAVSQ